MTDEPAIIDGTFADLKTVKTRSVIQMVIEVPIEYGTRVIDAFGFPQPGNEVHVAVARLNGPASQRPEPATRVKSYAQRIGIMCGEPAFKKFLYERADMLDETDDAAEIVRQICGVKSRSEIVEGSQAGMRWLDLDAEYKAWLTNPTGLSDPQDAAREIA